MVLPTPHVRATPPILPHPTPHPHNARSTRFTLRCYGRLQCSWVTPPPKSLKARPQIQAQPRLHPHARAFSLRVIAPGVTLPRWDPPPPPPLPRPPARVPAPGPTHTRQVHPSTGPCTPAEHLRLREEGCQAAQPTCCAALPHGLAQPRTPSSDGGPPQYACAACSAVNCDPQRAAGPFARPGRGEAAVTAPPVNQKNAVSASPPRAPASLPMPWQRSKQSHTPTPKKESRTTRT